MSSLNYSRTGSWTQQPQPQPQPQPQIPTPQKIGYQLPANNKIYVDFKSIRRVYEEHQGSKLEKWNTKIESYMNTNSKNILNHISTFLEKYSKVETEIYTIIDYKGDIVYPEDYITFNDATKLIFDDINKFIVNDSNTKLNIISDYYNTVTGKRGLLLENNIRVEDGQFLDKIHQKKVDNEIIKLINQRIEYILDPEKRKFLQREDKIKRILNF